MKTLSAIRAIVRQNLRDEFVSGQETDYEDDELDIIIQHTLSEISERRPYEVKETLTTTASSKELDISTIEDLLSIEKLEYPTGNYPRDYRNYNQIDASTIEIDTTLTPGASEDVYLYCHKLHQLTEESSTLSPQIETTLVLGAVAHAAIGKAQSHINKVSIGGQRTPIDLQNWGLSKLALYMAALRRLAKPRTYTRYSKG